MSVATERVSITESRAIDDYEYDLIHELGRRLSCLWGYDRCIAHAKNITELQAFWRNVKSQEQRNIDTLRCLISRHVHHDGNS